MVRRLMLGVAAAALLAAMVPGVAAASAPVGVCPLGEAAAWVAVQPVHVQPMDFNGDGWMCVKFQKDGSYAFHDNVVREP